MHMPIARRNLLGMAAGVALAPLSIGKAIAATPGEQAMDAATILRARMIVPIHFGVRGEEGDQEVEDPVGRLRRAEKSGGPKVQVLQPGEWLDPLPL